MGRLLLPVHAGRKMIKRNRWRILDGFHDFRECPECGALVHGDRGQALHSEHHAETDDALFGEPEAEEVGGYVVGSSGPVSGPDYYSDEG